MRETEHNGHPQDELGTTATPTAGDIEDCPGTHEDETLAPSEAFQALASEVRVAVLVELLHAEHADKTPQVFSDLQASVGSDSSARFAYHLRQLEGHFVQKDVNGYTLTAAGRSAAEAVLSGGFTRVEDRRAS